MKTTTIGEIDISPLINAHQALTGAIENDSTELYKVFQLSYELSWRTLQKVLTFYGEETNNATDTLQKASEQQLLDNASDWSQYTALRDAYLQANQTITSNDKQLIQQFNQQLGTLTKKLIDLQ